MSRISRQQFERLLWVVAAVALGIYAHAWIRASVYQWYADRSFVQALGAQPAAPQRVALLHKERPAPAPVDSDPSAPAADDVHWLGRLEIPRIALAVMINRGADREALATGVGHIQGTARPGEAGNSGIAGHRDTYFRKLRELRTGDTIRIVLLDGVHHYQVESIRVVDEKTSEVLRPTPWPSLTLVTCYPFWGVGPSRKRYIVHAVRIGE